mmetsp:Transcript_35195/g.105124  ORF Transcript_35195/g.105124 Transcript_35195/m.105124 type:complete len:213 (-) Transcript_35195:208-846(-)
MLLSSSSDCSSSASISSPSVLPVSPPLLQDLSCGAVISLFGLSPSSSSSCISSSSREIESFPVDSKPVVEGQVSDLVTDALPPPSQALVILAFSISTAMSSPRSLAIWFRAALSSFSSPAMSLIWEVYLDLKKSRSSVREATSFWRTSRVDFFTGEKNFPRGEEATWSATLVLIVLVRFSACSHSPGLGPSGEQIQNHRPSKKYSQRNPCLY